MSTCARCDGSGGVSCECCKGQGDHYTLIGTFIHGQSWETCSKCGGSGELPCPVCRGTGEIEED